MTDELKTTSPLVSIVVVHLDGVEQLVECLTSLERQSYPQLEIVLVDNGSTDGSVDVVRDRFPDVRIIELGSNRGFAAGVNEGARAAKGQLLGFVNDDARAHEDWVKEGITPMLLDHRVAATASLILSADGSTIDFRIGGAALTGNGVQLDHGDPAGGPVPARDVLFACGGAMFTRRSVFLDTGGFDESLFMYYEDVDYGWRLNVMGHAIRTAPRSVVYHHHHGTTERFADAKRHYHLERNALAVIFKNLEDDNLGHAFAASALLTGIRAAGDLDTNAWEFTSGIEVLSDVQLDPHRAGSLAAMKGFVDILPRLMESRRDIQRRRRRTDRDLMGLLRCPFMPMVHAEPYPRIFDLVMRALGVVDRLGGRKRVLVITEDVIGPKMSGPGIRALELSRALSADNDVVLLCSNEPRLDDAPPFRVERISPRRVNAFAEWADLILFQGFALDHYPEIGRSGKSLIVDLYDPFHYEALEQFSHERPRDQLRRADQLLEKLNDQLTLGDFFICASEKQRDMWLGHLTALGRVDPAAYLEDPTLRTLIDVVPFGVPADPPAATGAKLRRPEGPICPDDKLLLWGGGIYEWLDPFTPIKAMAKIVAQDPSVKLFFLGTAHPSPNVPPMPIVDAARRLARDLGVDGNVIFNDDWVPYAERAGILLEADVGVTAHPLHIETTYSFRTRVLDYFWAGLPVVTTEGDAIADLVERRGAGASVPPEDPDAFADAVLRLLDEDQREECVNASLALAREFSWERAAAPLLAACRRPRRAVEGGDDAVAPRTRHGVRRQSRLRKAIALIRSGQFRLLTVHMLNTLRGRLTSEKP